MGGGGVSQRNRTCVCLPSERLSDTQHPQFIPTLAIAIIDMRPSVASLRSSLAPSAHHPPSAETLAGLDQKKKEAEAVDALQRASALFLQRLEGLADDCEAMADAGAGARPFPFSHGSTVPRC